jgi:hypothetical protein
MTVKTKLPRKPSKVRSYAELCMACFATVSDCDPEGRPAEHNKAHICDSAFLAERGLLTRIEPKRHSTTHLPDVAA